MEVAFSALCPDFKVSDFTKEFGRGAVLDVGVVGFHNRLGAAVMLGTVGILVVARACEARPIIGEFAERNGDNLEFVLLGHAEAALERATTMAT